MQHPCRQCYRGSRCAQHLAEKLVRKRHMVGLHPIVTGQKPSGQALTDGVEPVTRRVLCTLNQAIHARRIQPLYVPVVHGDLAQQPTNVTADVIMGTVRTQDLPTAAFNVNKNITAPSVKFRLTATNSRGVQKGFVAGLHPTMRVL